MKNQLKVLTQTLLRFRPHLSRSQLTRASQKGLLVGALVWGGYALYTHPPITPIAPGNIGLRSNQFTGQIRVISEGSALVIPGLHHLQQLPRYDLRYSPSEMSEATGPAPLQSVEGLSLGIDLNVRYALDPNQLLRFANQDVEMIEQQRVSPAVQGVIYKIFARYTVREIFSTKRTEIVQSIENELKPRFATEGLELKSVQLGKVDLPADYRKGMETLLAEELASEKMRYTLELKEKKVKETELEAEAEKVRREKAADASAREQIIAAKGQEEAMKHILPFKQRQIEQRQLEAEAEKAARIRTAEGSAQARRIEAAGEADARQKLAEAEAFRVNALGKVNATQMEREGQLITQHPLLIQKAMADKLSDKIQVIIAPPTQGAFIGAALLGGGSNTGVAPSSAASTHTEAGE